MTEPEEPIQIEPGTMVRWQCPRCPQHVHRVWQSYDNASFSAPHCPNHGYPWVAMERQIEEAPA